MSDLPKFVHLARSARERVFTVSTAFGCNQIGIRRLIGLPAGPETRASDLGMKTGGIMPRDTVRWATPAHARFGMRTAMTAGFPLRTSARPRFSAGPTSAVSDTDSP